MLHLRQLILLGGALLLGLGASAQGRGFLSREALDSLVNPSVSTKATGILECKEGVVNVGTISDESVVEVRYLVRNTSNRSVVITQLRSSCGCLKVATSPTAIEPNGSVEVVANFDPKGRNSSFRYNILLYTELDNTYPSLRLTLVGEVESHDSWSHLPYRMGGLRLSRKEVTINSRGVERIACANSTDSPMRLSARETVAGLSLRTEPEVIAPNSEADIVISYDPAAALATELRTMLIVEGIEAPPTERMITITITK